MAKFITIMYKYYLQQIKIIVIIIIIIIIMIGEGILLTVENLNYHKQQIYIYIIYYTQFNMKTYIKLYIIPIVTINKLVLTNRLNNDN